MRLEAQQHKRAPELLPGLAQDCWKGLSHNSGKIGPLQSFAFRIWSKR